MIEQLVLWTALFGTAVAAVYALQKWHLRRSYRRDHALGRERLSILMTAARDEGFILTGGDYRECGEATRFELSHEADGLACSLEFVQKLDHVEVWFGAAVAGRPDFLKLSKSVREAIFARQLLLEAREAFEARKNAAPQAAA